jgi:hypothetical protein
MDCRNLCERLYSKIIFGKSHYEGGKIVFPIMTTTEIDEIQKRWARLRVCNVFSKRFQGSREMRKHKDNDHSY